MQPVYVAQTRISEMMDIILMYSLIIEHMTSYQRVKEKIIVDQLTDDEQKPKPSSLQAPKSSNAHPPP